MKVARARTQAVPNEIEFETPSTMTTVGKEKTAAMTSAFAARSPYPRDGVEAFRSAGKSLREDVVSHQRDHRREEEDDDDDVMAFRDSLEEEDDANLEERQEITPSLKNLRIPTEKFHQRERQNAIDDISLTGDTAPSSAILIKQATTSKEPSPNEANDTTISTTPTKKAMRLPIQSLNALAQNHLNDCGGGLPIGLVADDELVKNMRVGVGIAGNVAGRAANKAPGGKVVIHGVKAGLAYAEETAQSAKKLISDTKQLAKDMDIKKFAASSASYSFEDEMFRLSDETDRSDDRSSSNNSTSRSFRYTDSDASSYSSRDDDLDDAETMQSSFVTQNASDIYTVSVAPSNAEDLSLVPPHSASFRGRNRKPRNKPPRAMKRFTQSHTSADAPKDQDTILSNFTEETLLDDNSLPRLQDQTPADTHIGPERTVSGAVSTNNLDTCQDATINDDIDADVGDVDDGDDDYTEVTYQSEQGAGVEAPVNPEGVGAATEDGDSSEYTEVTVPDDDSPNHSPNVEKEDNEKPLEALEPKQDTRNCIDTDRVISAPNMRPEIITTVQFRNSEQILADNTADVPPVEIDWIDPPPEQASLIAAVLSTSIGRRSNACGTIKMMASNKARAVALARTRILLDALILAINDGRQHHGEEMELFIEAQSRATIAISYLSEVKENRILLAQHPGLVKALIEVIRKDKGEARVAACRSLVMLSKMQQNKALLVKTDGLVGLLADIMSDRYDQRTVDDENTRITSSFSMQSNSNGGSQSRGGNSSMGGSLRKSTSAASRGSMTIRQCKSARYQEYLSLSRVNCCAAFSHLAKDCASSAILCKDETFIGALLSLCSNTRSPMYKRCLEILVHLTRFCGNGEALASNNDLIKVLVTSVKAKCLEERICAFRSMQNISATCAESRMILATDSILDALISAAFEGSKEEQELALGTILNLALETGTFVSLTNSKNFTAVLIHVINSAEVSSTSCKMARQVMRLIANWMNTLADTGDDNTAAQIVVKPTGWMLYS